MTKNPFVDGFHLVFISDSFTTYLLFAVDPPNEKTQKMAKSAIISKQ